MFRKWVDTYPSTATTLLFSNVLKVLQYAFEDLAICKRDGRIPFTFSITTAAGLRGTCLLLAVPVDAPVGVHLGQNEIGGDGANLG